MTYDMSQIIQEDKTTYSRPYKSRRQRPCDFCRKRKSCCIIEGTAPCKLCRTFKRECTFIEGPISRPKPRFDENGERIVTRKRSPSVLKKDTEMVTKPKRKRGRKPKSFSVERSEAQISQDIDSSIIDPALVKPPGLIRRFSAPVSAAKELKKPVLDFDFVNESNNIIATNNELLLENLHYSLEDHNANSELLPVTNNDNWRNVFGYLVDSPLLQPQKLEDLSKSPFLHATIPEPSPYNEVFMNSNSSSTSQISGSIRPTESVTSFDSPGSSISGASIQQDDMYPSAFWKTKTSLSGFQFNHSENNMDSYIDPFIFSILGNDRDKVGNTNDSFKHHGIGIGSDPKKVTTKYLNFQKDIFAILDKYGDKLINLYLTYVDPFLPILSQSQINFIFNNGEFTRSSIISSLKRLNLALITSIIASSLEYWDLDNELILDESPAVDMVTEMALDLIFSEFELRSYSNAQSRYDLLQSCLIICIKCSFDITKLEHLFKIDILTRINSISFTLILELGLDIDFKKYSSSTQDPKDDDLIFKNNLWWCFYIHEKWFSLLTGKQSQIHEETFDLKVNIQTPSNMVSVLAPFKKEDGADVTSYETLHRNCGKYFEQMINLTLILSEVLKNFCQPNEDELDQSLTNEQYFNKLFQKDELANVMIEKLLKWRDNTPEFFEFNGNKESVRGNSKIFGYINANASVNMSYYVTSLTIHKAMLKKFSNKYMKLASFSDMNNSLLLNGLKKFETRFNNLKLNAIKVSFDCSRSIKALKLQDLNGFWYLFINFKLIFLTNFFILLHMVVDKTSNDLNPPLPFSNKDLAQSANYNNNLQFKSTMQKIISDFKCCVKNRSSKWKFARLANDLFKNFKSFEDIDVLENYANSSSLKHSPSSMDDFHQGNLPIQRGPNNSDVLEPLSLDEEEAHNFELLHYDEKFIIV